MFLFQAEDGIRDLVRSRGLGDVYKRQGVLESKGAAFGGGQDNMAVIPLTTGLNRYGRIWSLSLIHI